MRPIKSGRKNLNTNMNVSDLAGSSSIQWESQSMSAVSGASSYVPAAATPSTDPLLAQMRSDIKQNSQDFKALKQALNSNDLTGATQAFATLQQDIQNASQAAGGKSPFDPNSAIGKDFQAIGDALKSGDVSAAKQAFATFKQDIKSAGRAARASHHAAQGANDGDVDDSTQSSATPPSTPAATSTIPGTVLNTIA